MRSGQMQMRRVRLGPALFCGLFAISGGCVPDGGTPAGSGGRSGGTGGAGAPATGGQSGTGGAGTGGAASASGGMSGTGGIPGTGTGGRSETGGAASGGDSGLGGVSGTGGGPGTGTGGSGETGGTGSGGDSGLGGESGSGGAGGQPFVLKCDLPSAPVGGPVLATMPVISDFTYTDGTDAVRATNFSFGNYFDSPSGYSFHYPDRNLSDCGGAGGASAGTGGRGAGGTAGSGGGGAGGGGSSGTGGGPPGGTCAAPGLSEDLTGSTWHIVGRVNSAASFAIGVVCNIDASAYAGIEFTIKGTAGTPSELRMEVGFAGDTRGSHDPDNPALGTCDFDCNAPSTVIPVTATETLIRLPWSMFRVGTPMPSVNPTAINSISWGFLNGSSTNAYNVDVTLDNLHFMEAALPTAASAR
jgi:hypothetical protein